MAPRVGGVYFAQHCIAGGVEALANKCWINVAWLPMPGQLGGVVRPMGQAADHTASAFYESARRMCILYYGPYPPSTFMNTCCFLIPVPLLPAGCVSWPTGHSHPSAGHTGRQCSQRADGTAAGVHGRLGGGRCSVGHGASMPQAIAD